MILLKILCIFYTLQKTILYFLLKKNLLLNYLLLKSSNIILMFECSSFITL